MGLKNFTLIVLKIQLVETNGSSFLPWVCCLLKTVPLPEGWDGGLNVEELGSSHSLAISVLETVGPFIV